MAYPARHHEEVRKKIVDSARRVFNRKGFDGASISEIMLGAGLTRGGFYFYFGSKSDLYREAMNCFLTDPEWKNCWEGVEVDLTASDAGAQVVSAYLSHQHFENVENSCPMVALPSDVARSDEETKQAFEAVFRAMVSLLERSVRCEKTQARGRARALAAMSVGGMVVARALSDLTYADELRRSCLEIAVELGGWEKRKLKRRVTRSKRSRPHAVNR